MAKLSQMWLVCAALVAAAVLCAAYLAHQGQASTGTSCTEKYMVVGSRGSGNDFGDDPITDKYGEVVKGMGSPSNAFTVAFANLYPKGQVVFARNYYPAKGGIPALLGAITRIGPLGAYNDSVVEGRKDLAGLINRQISACPKVKLVLTGYSQGAQVTGDAYQQMSSGMRRHIFAVVLFGDPEFNPQDTADQSQINKHEHGALGDRPIFPASKHVLSYCHAHDPVCQWPISSPDCKPLRGSLKCKALIAEALVYRFTKHENYDKLGEPQDAAQKLFKALSGAASSGKHRPTGNGNSEAYVAKTDNGYTGRIQVSTRGVFRLGKIPPLPTSGRTQPGSCSVGPSDGIVEVSFSVTNLTKRFATPIGVMPIADSSQSFLHIDNAGCWEGPNGGLLMSSTKALSYGSSLRGDYFIIIPDYFSPAHPEGNAALARAACTDVNAFFGQPGTASFKQLWPAQRRWAMPLVHGTKGCQS